jgi:hypothetical protein
MSKLIELNQSIMQLMDPPRPTPSRRKPHRSIIEKYEKLNPEERSAYLIAQQQPNIVPFAEEQNPNRLVLAEKSSKRHRKSPLRLPSSLTPLHPNDLTDTYDSRIDKYI